jgi:uncharacterized protein (DUF433 family)
MAKHERVVSDPSVMLGKPVILGTRITVEQILEELGAGMTFDGLLEAYPRLERADIEAALEFALDAVRLERVRTLRVAS